MLSCALFPCPSRQKRANNLQDIIEQLSANKADRRELLELKQFMVSLNVSPRVAVKCIVIEKWGVETFTRCFIGGRPDCSCTLLSKASEEVW